MIRTPAWLVLLAVLTAGCAPRKGTSELAHNAAAPCPERLLLLETENQDVFVIPAPSDLCQPGSEQLVSEERIAAITESLLMSANQSSRPRVKSTKAQSAALMAVAGCCRVRVRWRVVVKPPEVTVRGTSVTATAPDVTVGMPELRGEGFPEIRIGGDGPPTGSSTECRHMTGPQFIPAGHHPVSVKWMPGDPRGDLVCTQKTEGQESRFVPWHDVPMPSGYHVLYEYPNPSTSFNGCRRWSTWQGTSTCIDMYPLYQLRKNGD